jgi:hypothetical protein
MIHGFLTLDTLSPAAAAAGERVFDNMSRLIKPYQLEKSWVSQTVPELSR